ASEKLSQVPQVIATIIQNGKSKNKIDVNVLMTLVEGTEATYKGTFKKITGFGDVEKIIITGTDLAGNVGISDGTFTKELLTKAAAIAEQTADPTFKLGDVYTYPNPAISGQNPIIHIEVGVADRVEIKIFNIAAELVHSVEFASSDYLKIKNDKYCYEYPLDISNIASGVYIYCLNAEKQGYVPIKMIKKCAVIK
ncbi:MAG: T9SS type A sorting domain-containing protein, partial [Elusimicrobiota bacterium]